MARQDLKTFRGDEEILTKLCIIFFHQIPKAFFSSVSQSVEDLVCPDVSPCSRPLLFPSSSVLSRTMALGVLTVPVSLPPSRPPPTHR